MAKNVDEYSSGKRRLRANAALRVALNTPPKPHRPIGKRNKSQSNVAAKRILARLNQSGFLLVRLSNPNARASCPFRLGQAYAVTHRSVRRRICKRRRATYRRAFPPSPPIAFLGHPPHPALFPRRPQMGILSSALKTSSITPIESSPAVIETINGMVQLSSVRGQSTFGLLVERAGFSVGTRLSLSQAKQLASVLLDRIRLNEEVDT